MKFEDFPKVTELTEKLGRLANAISDAEAYIASADGDDTDYWCHLARHKDGSGPSVDMNGCYVAIKVAVATQKVLEDEHKATVEELKELGIEFK